MFGWLRRKVLLSEPVPIKFAEDRPTRLILIPGKHGYHICGSVAAIEYALSQNYKPAYQRR